MSLVPPRRRATINTVAREAGVATSTVSRTFTNPARVNQRTRAHVEAVAERLGYAPNPAAQALESGRTNTVALTVPDIGDPYYAGVIKGSERAAAGARLTLVLGETQGNALNEERLVRRLGPAVDGFVLAGSRLSDEALQRVAELNPVVLVNRVSRGLPGVVADYATGTRQIVAHLASHGHRSFVFLGGPEGSWSGGRRWAGLQEAAQEHGLAARLLGPYAPTLAAGPDAADAVLHTGCTAVVAANDLLAIGVLQRLTGRGVLVPDEVTVVGFENTFGADFCHPPLTTLAERTCDAGASAVEVLVSRSRSEAVELPAVKVLSTQLVVRGSSGAAAIRVRA